MLSCAHWLSWRLGMGAKSASERVRVARALRGLPQTFAAFAAGRLSFTQVRAITRVATTEDEQSYLDVARHAAGSQLERLVRGIRRARRLAKSGTDEGAPAPKPVRVTVGYDEDGGLRITVRASAEAGAVMLAALEAARADLDSTPAMPAGPDASAADRPDASAEESAEPRRATEGDGLLRLCQGYLRQRAQAHPGRARRDRARLTVQVDPLSGWARLPDGELLPPTVAGQRQAALTLPGHTAASHPASRPHPARRRPPPPRTRPGPTRPARHRRRRTLPLPGLLPAAQAARPSRPPPVGRRWPHRPGKPDPFYALHTVVHADGFLLTLHPATRTLTVTSSTGTAVPHRPPLPWRPAEELDPTGAVTPNTLPPITHDRLDLHYAVSVLLQHAA